MSLSRDEIMDAPAKDAPVLERGLPRYEFVSLDVLSRCASICGPGSFAADALVRFSAVADHGGIPVCLQVIDGRHPSELLVFAATNPPEELPKPWRRLCKRLSKIARFDTEPRPLG